MYKKLFPLALTNFELGVCTNGVDQCFSTAGQRQIFTGLKYQIHIV
jgi:hypothetical protein